jgi:starch phosphorylase
VLDAIAGGRFSPDEPGRYRALVDSLLWGGDHYMLLADFDGLRGAQARVDALYRQPRPGHARPCQRRRHGAFSSDRTIREYAHQVWHLDVRR